MAEQTPRHRNIAYLAMWGPPNPGSLGWAWIENGDHDQFESTGRVAQELADIEAEALTTRATANPGVIRAAEATDEILACTMPEPSDDAKRLNPFLDSEAKRPDGPLALFIWGIRYYAGMLEDDDNWSHALGHIEECCAEFQLAIDKRAGKPATDDAIIRAAEGVVLEPGEYVIVSFSEHDSSPDHGIGERFVITEKQAAVERDEMVFVIESIDSWSWVTAVRRVTPIAAPAPEPVASARCERACSCPICMPYWPRRTQDVLEGVLAQLATRDAELESAKARRDDYEKALNAANESRMYLESELAAVRAERGEVWRSKAAVTSVLEAELARVTAERDEYLTRIGKLEQMLRETGEHSPFAQPSEPREIVVGSVWTQTLMTSMSRTVTATIDGVVHYTRADGICGAAPVEWFVDNYRPATTSEKEKQ